MGHKKIKQKEKKLFIDKMCKKMNDRIDKYEKEYDREDIFRKQKEKNNETLSSRGNPLFLIGVFAALLFITTIIALETKKYIPLSMTIGFVLPLAAFIGLVE